MKRMIVVIFIMLLVAGGGAGGLIMMGIVPNPFNPKVEVKLSASEEAAAEASKKKFVAPTSALKLVKVSDMILPVIMNGQVKRRVFLTMRIVAAASDKEKIIETNLPWFQGAVVADLVPFLQTYYSQHDTLDIALIKMKLAAHAKQVYGEDTASDVLLVNVFEQ
jgi:uncharacterized protein YybS (DUF2232 family)